MAKRDVCVIGVGMIRRAAATVYERTGIAPDNVDVIELHDCFSTDRGTDGDPPAVVCKEIEELGSKGGARATTSVTEHDGAGRILKTALDAWGHCDILVNNAGIAISSWSTWRPRTWMQWSSTT